jgi:hypothetical protein
LHRAGFGDFARIGVENQAKTIGTLIISGDFRINLFDVIAKLGHHF